MVSLPSAISNESDVFGILINAEEVPLDPNGFDERDERASLPKTALQISGGQGTIFSLDLS